MAHSTPEALAFDTQLRIELDWLLRNHPGRTALARIATNYLETIKQASSCETLCISSNRPPEAQ